MPRYKVTMRTGRVIIVYADDPAGAKRAALRNAPAIAGKRIDKVERERELSDFDKLTYAQQIRRINKLLRLGILSEHHDEEDFAISHGITPRGYV